MQTYDRLLKLLKRSPNYLAFELKAVKDCTWYLKGLQSWTKADLRIFWEQHTQEKIEPTFMGGW